MEGRVRVETDLHSRKEVGAGDKTRPSFRTLCVSSGPWLALCIIGTAVLRPILWSAFSADDTFDSLLPMNLRFSGGSFWSFVDGVVTGWKTNEGRFFPVAVLVGGLSHLWFPEREAYKAAQFLMALLVVVLFAAFVALLMRNKWNGILAGLFLLAASQMRVQYDPVLQFSLQQPSLMTMVLASVILFVIAMRKESSPILFASMIFFLAATLTYESSVLLWPVYPCIALYERRKGLVRWVLPTMIAPTAVVGHLLYLRSQVSTTSAGYTSNFEIPVLVRTFLKQAGASIPMTYAEVNAPPFVLGFTDHLQPTHLWWLVAVILTMALGLLSLKRIRVVSWTQIGVLGAAGLTLWFLPAVVVAQTTRWQEEIVSGNAYIPVYQGNIGFSLVAVSVIVGMVKLTHHKKKVTVTVILGVLSCLSVAVSSVVSNNPRAVAQYDASFRYGRDVFTNAIKEGLFSKLGESKKVLSLSPDWWLTPSVVYWYGGVRLGNFVTPQSQSEFARCVDEMKTCQSALGISLYLGTYGRFPEDTRVILVGNVERMTGDGGMIKGIRVSKPSLYVVYPDSAPSASANDSEVRCSAWLLDRLSIIGESATPRDITVEKATEKSCLIRTHSGVSLNPMRFTPA